MTKRDPLDDTVESPELRELLLDIRARERLPRVNVTADQIFERFQTRRRERRLRWQRVGLGGAAVALAAWVVATVGHGSFTMSEEPVPSLAALHLDEPAVPRVVADASGIGDDVIVAPPALDPDIRVERLEPDGAPLEIVGPRALHLAGGTYTIEHTSDPLGVTTPDGALRFTPGVFTVAVAAARTDVHILEGQATWIAGGNATTTRPAGPLVAAAPASVEASAADLARLAEEHLAAGRQRQAARALRRLVTAHSGSEEAGRGLLDLARLDRAMGSPDQARCAYQLYLRRYPSSPLRADVESAIDRLGPGPACNGLGPR